MAHRSLSTCALLALIMAFALPQDATDEPTEAQRRSASYWRDQAPLPSADELAGDPAAHDELLTESGLVLDMEKRELRVRAGVIHDKLSLSYPIEYLIVTDRGQVHESIFMVAARPMLVNRCLEAIGLAPGRGMTYDYTNENRSSWITHPAHGELVEIVIEWLDDAGRRQSVPLENMLIDLETGEALDKRGWVYVGSRMAEVRQGRDTVERYLADLEGNVVAIYLDGRGACLFERNSLNGVGTPYTLHPDRVPPRETSVTIAFRPTGNVVDKVEGIPGGIVLAGGPDAKRHDELEHAYGERESWWKAAEQPSAFAVGDDGELYAVRDGVIDVVDGETGAVQRSLDVDIAHPSVVVPVRSDEGLTLWVATTSPTRVVAVDGETGAIMKELTAPADAWQADGVAVSSDGEVFVSDGAASVVRHFGASGAQVGTIGEPGDRLGQFTSPSGLTIDSRGRYPHLLVADSGDGRIQAFDLDGRYLAVVARRLNGPTALAVRGRFMVVTESSGRLTILDELDRTVTRVGDEEVEEAAITCTRPTHSAWNPRGDLFVLDDGRVRRLDRRESDG